MSHAPVEPGKAFIPDYYRSPDPIEIATIYEMGPALSWALKYLLRAGRKQGESEVKDLTKAMEMIQRRIMQLTPAEPEALRANARHAK
jgi:hypothetical protein